MEELRRILRTTWGFDGFRPLQAEAMQAVLEGRDSVVVLPTGGGKSLCYQAPALQLPGLAVIVSPLISLMMDQVGALLDNGVPAAAVTSASSLDERRQAAQDARAGRLKLLYLSPERLMTERTLDFLQQAELSFVAIDEAHCISDWGHDFRPEYRMLRRLKQTFPGLPVHAYTATATARVRQDIARELELVDPAMLVGSFDRPNLVYRVRPRTDLRRQLLDVIDRHAGQAGIVYCIRRRDVDDLCGMLQAAGHAALPYHAGLSDEERRRNQEAFSTDQTRIVVATVAFGMGIDKSDVRFVVHAAAPKSLEAYQQESGRAGRDGLEAECCLFYSPGDFLTWRKLQSDLPAEAARVAQTVLAGIENFCQSVGCRHRAILEYFGQELEQERCQACDVCLEEVEWSPDALVIAQKILSCVLRLEESFGADYTALVLTGSREQRILSRGHDRLSTWNLLGEHSKSTVRGWIDQLAGQGLLERAGEFGVLQVTDEGWQVLRGQGAPRLSQPAAAGPQREARVERASWEGVDRGLFERLRAWRKAKSAERGLPPFIILGDASLRDLARRRPSTSAGLHQVHGIGDKKAADYGHELLELLAEYCQQHEVNRDAAGVPPAVTIESNEPRTPNAARLRAWSLFSAGRGVDEVAADLGRARSTTMQYLAEYIAKEQLVDPQPWVDEATFVRIRSAWLEQEDARLRPIFEALGEQVDYDSIRLAVGCLKNAAALDGGGRGDSE
ncbi:MAG: DNA helicase RecQ [Pirellulales bacterium]